MIESGGVMRHVMSHGCRARTRVSMHELDTDSRVQPRASERARERAREREREREERQHSWDLRAIPVTAFIKINLGLKVLIKLTSERTLMAYHGLPLRVGPWHPIGILE